MLTKSLAYEKWLGIRKEQQPPSLYRLLAIDAFESDKEVIANAVDSRMGFVRQFQAGENSTFSAEILNELARARVILLNPQKKAAYDAQLRASMSSTADDALERESQSLIVLAPIESAPFAKPVLRARQSETVQPVPESGQAAPANVDIESLVSESAAAGSSKRHANARKATYPLGAIIVAGIVVAGCLIAALIYVTSSGRQNSPKRAPRMPHRPPILRSSKALATKHRLVVPKWQPQVRWKTAARPPAMLCCQNRRPLLRLFSPTMKTTLQKM